jgi:hypothetical protein
MKNHYSLLLILLLFSQHVFSQKIAGFVHNSHNEPIAGVSVSILKTTKGVSTDPEGRFQIEESQRDVIPSNLLSWVLNHCLRIL